MSEQRETQEQAAGSREPVGSVQSAFICAIRCVTDAAIHSTLMPRPEMARILREEAKIIEDNREHFATPKDHLPNAADGFENHDPHGTKLAELLDAAIQPPPNAALIEVADKMRPD